MKRVLLVAATLSGSIPASSSVAQTASEKLAFCEIAGELAHATTAARDAGVPIEQAQSLADDVTMDARAKSFIEALITLTYTMDGVEGPLMRQVAVQLCQKNMGLK